MRRYIYIYMPHKSLGLFVNWVTECAQAKAGDPLVGVLTERFI